MTDPVIEHCRVILEQGSRSFAKAASLLDPTIRAGSYQLYAWCRYCDDVIDGQTMGHGQQIIDPAEQRKQLAILWAETEAAYRGEPTSDLVFQGIARVVQQHGIPPDMPFELLRGMEMDIEGRQYETLEQLRVYCYHVAGVVGVMMARIMGIRDEATLQRAEDLGTAMQFTNISRDVIDDARIGRVYLPLGWLREAGLAPADVGRPEYRGTVAAIVRRLLDEAERYYQSGDSGIDHLPFRCAWSITAARGIYSEIGAVIRSRGDEAWDRRAMVSGGRKVFWMSRSLLETAIRRITR